MIKLKVSMTSAVIISTANSQVITLLIYILIVNNMPFKVIFGILLFLMMSNYCDARYTKFYFVQTEINVML